MLSTLTAISVQPEFPVSITENFKQRMEHHFPQFLEKRTTSGTIPKFSMISYWEILIHPIFTSEFQEFLVEWFAFGKINNFPNSDFPESSKEFFKPVDSVSKVPDFLVVFCP